jgi:hypothetical protein
MRNRHRSETSGIRAQAEHLREDDPNEQFCAVSSEAVPAGRGETWTYDHIRRRFQSVPESLSQLLPLLSGFRTLKEHRRTIVQAGWQDDGSGYLDATLRELIHHGLLRSKTDFLRNIQTHGDRSDAPPPITTIGWVTCDRRVTLRESVQSFVAEVVKSGRKVELKIFDDSSQTAEREATRAMVLDLGKQTGLPIRYAGAEEKRIFADELIRQLMPEGVSRELIEFALFDPFELGYSVGANINAFLLATQGELALKLDDDTFCRFASPVDPKAGLALFSLTDATRIRLFPDRTSLERDFPLRESDALRVHEILLGRTVAGCISTQEAQTIHCEEGNPALLQLLESHPARVIATMTGLYGDSGMASSRYFLSLTGGDRDALVCSEQNYRASLRSRQLLRAVACPTISQGEMFMAMNCGFDNRTLLPPFFPVLRNSDGLFAQVLRRSMLDGLIGHLPLAGDHRPPGVRRFADNEQRSMTIRLMDLLILLVRDFHPGSGHGASRECLCSLGTYLIVAASLAPMEFDEHLRRLWVEEMARYIDHLERLLAVYGEEPDYWAEDVEVHIEAIRRRVDAGPDVTPEDVTERKGAENALTLLRLLVRYFGELLVAWPVIAGATRRLKAAGGGI